MDRYNDMFFIIELQNPLNLQSMGPIIDPDEVRDNALMDTRDPFLVQAKKCHWEFSSLRRAKWSTKEFIYELHICSKSIQEGISCNVCNKTVDAANSMHCKICEDFDLCNSCYEEKGHEHSMVQNESTEESGKNKAQLYRKALVHASSCRNANCKQAGCLKMRKILKHAKECKHRAIGRIVSFSTTFLVYN